MHSQQQKRSRGVLLTPQGLKKIQAATSEAANQENHRIRYSLEALSARVGLDTHTLSKIYAGQVRVDRRSLSRCFSAFNLRLELNDYQQQIPEVEMIEEAGRAREPGSLEVRTRIGSQPSKSQNFTDWGNVPDISTFYGRTEELATLKSWITEESCRLVVLSGMGGIGKTWLSVKLAIQIQEQFDFVIWRSLSNAAPIQNILSQLLQCLPDKPQINLSKTLNNQISQLVEYLRDFRCLLIFDNVETILQGRELNTESGNFLAGLYRLGYEGYGELFKHVGEVQHQSCLMMTSREIPKGIQQQKGKNSPVRNLLVKGMQIEQVQELLQHEEIQGTLPDLNRLTKYYAGNPLCLKIVARSIQTLFNGNLAEFLKQGTTVFSQIHDLLDRQLERLSDIELEIMKVLAVQSNPVSFADLRSQILTPISSKMMLETMESLNARSLLDNKDGCFFLVPKLVDYLKTQYPNEILLYSKADST